jgi:hypothetical protein
MNIAVLGSNCKFSSDLAIQLNQLKQSSLVYRYDLLADFKKSVPLYKSLLNNTKDHKSEAVDVDFEEQTVLDAPTKKEIKTSALGEYVGDVETSFIEVPKKEEELKKFKILKTTFDMLDIEVSNFIPIYSVQCAIKKLIDARKNSEMFTSNLLNIINVYSGILNFQTLNLLLSDNPLTLIIKVKNDDTFLPCTITKEQLSELTKKNPQAIILEVSSVHELLMNNFFIATFNLKEKKERKEIVEEQKEVIGEIHNLLANHDGFLQHMMNQGGAGMMAQMMAA